MPPPKTSNATRLVQLPIVPLRLISFSVFDDLHVYFLRLSSMADFIASKTFTSTASFATRTAFLMANASDLP